APALRRKKMLTVGEHDTVARIGKRASALDQRERLPRFRRQTRDADFRQRCRPAGDGDRGDKQPSERTETCADETATNQGSHLAELKVIPSPRHCTWTPACPTSGSPTFYDCCCSRER